MRHDERLSAILTEMRDRHDLALDIRAPDDDVPDYITGFNDALAATHAALTTSSKEQT